MSTSLTSTPQRINVLEIIGNAIVGGMETYVARLIERLPPDRFNVVALCPFESPYTDRLRDLQVEVMVVPMPDDPAWSTISTVCALAKAQAIDVIHAHMPNAHTLAGIVGRMTGKPVLATIHTRQLTTVDLEVHRTAGTSLSVVCKHTHLHALGLGANPAQVHCIPNGVDTQVFQPQTASGSLWRQRHGIGPKVPLVGFVGRLSHEKAPDMFLRVASLLHQMNPEVHFVMVGEGPMEASLRRFAEQFNLSGCLHLIGVQTDMPAVYNELDVVLSTSHSEAMPFALMEAMACGVPVVATRVGGVPDLVQHGQTGWLISPGEDLLGAQQINGMLRDASALQAMGQKARQRCVDRFSMDVSANAMMDLLARLAAPARSERRISAVVSASGVAAGATATAATGTAAARTPGGKLGGSVARSVDKAASA